MRIAFIVQEFPALSETFILNQITGLIDMGHDVRIFAQYQSTSSQIHEDVIKYKLISRTHYIPAIPRNKNYRRIKTFLLLLKNMFKSPLVVCRALRLLMTWEYGFLYNYLYYLFPFLGRRFDIIQCHFGQFGNIGAFVKQAGIDAKVVTMFHGVGIRRGIEQGGKIYKNLFEHGDRILAISQYNYENLIAFGADPNTIIIHPVGINLKSFPVSSEDKNLPPDRAIRILSVARLVEEKGLHYGIETIKTIIHRRPALSLRYDIVGAGPLESKLTDLIRTSGLQDTVFLLGPKSQDQVIQSLMQADLFLMPSIAEALPVALMEAQAASLPCVATRVGSSYEIVQDGASGFLIPPTDIQAMTEKLEYLIDNPNLWPKMGQAARRQIEQNFDITTLNRKLEKIYLDLLAE